MSYLSLKYASPENSKQWRQVWCAWKYPHISEPSQLVEPLSILLLDHLDHLLYEERERRTKGEFWKIKILWAIETGHVNSQGSEIRRENIHLGHFMNSFVNKTLVYTFNIDVNVFKLSNCKPLLNGTVFIKC